MSCLLSCLNTNKKTDYMLRNYSHFFFHTQSMTQSSLYKINYELIRTVLKVWKPLLTISHRYLFQRLKPPAVSEKLSSAVDLIYDVFSKKSRA